jgi:site-specific DNA recombinase
VFQPAQAKLAGRAVSRKLRLSRSPSFLCGLLFDDRGNRMSPSHANKRGVRYRYYVSQAVLQSRKADIGSIGRVSAPDLEREVVAALRKQIPSEADVSDRDLLARHVERIVLRAKRIEMILRITESPQALPAGDDMHIPPLAGEPDHVDELDSGSPAPIILVLPWSPATSLARKGIAFAPADRPRLDPTTRDLLLRSIARARAWTDGMVAGTIASFDEIARQEGKAERHIRRLAPLAFLSPKIVQAIADGTAPADLTVTSLTAALPHSWVEQERRFGIV